MKQLFTVSACVAALFTATALQAANLSFGPTNVRTTTAEEVAAGAPAGAMVHEFFIASTDNDILSVDQVNISVPTFNVAPPFGSDVANNGPDFGGINAAVRADSFITTPGGTSTTGGGLGTPNASYFDTSNDGPVSNFLFARMTTDPGVTGTFAGRVNVTNGAGQAPSNFAFSYTLGIPEPTSIALFAVGMVGLVGLRRRVG